MKKTKLKIRKSVSLRFRVTGGGKIMHRLSFRRHLKASKSKRQRRQKEVPLTGANFRKIRKALGVG